jgi:hypothetical protein
MTLLKSVLDKTAAENKTQLLGPGLAETPEFPNTIMVGNSLIFLMVHNMAPNG